MSDTTEMTKTTETTQISAAEDAPKTDGTAEKKWVIMVYMAGDNNLNVEMVYALEQLKEAAKINPAINLYVYYDGLSSDVPTLYCDFSHNFAISGTEDPVNYFQSHTVKNKLIDVGAEFNENSAAVSNIINFIDWCVKKDSAAQIKEKKYAFIFSGHSFGFLNWGLFKDDKADYYMTHAKLKYLFERITSTEKDLIIKAEADEDQYFRQFGVKWSERRRRERTTVVLGKPLDLLGFDSCVMSTLELGSQFRKFSKTMVASEGSIPTAGWNYAQILLGEIKANPQSDAKKIAVNFVETFIKQQNKFALADISVDISAWDLTCLPTLEDSFAELVDDLLECFRHENSVGYNQMKRLIHYVHWQSQTYMFEQHVDLSDFCQNLVSEIEMLKREVPAADLSSVIKVSQSCKKVVENIADCILLTGFSGTDFQFSKGISLFFPWSWASYYSAQSDYEKLTFVRKNYAGIRWNEFLQLYLGEISMRFSNHLTRFDEQGNTSDISVVYESYDNLEDETGISDTSVNDRQPPNSGRQPPNSGRQPPNSGRQPPNSGRQPPNSGRQPPNSGRMFGDMNVFLTRFLRFKNLQFNWNRSGFTSKNVTFKTSELPSLPNLGQTGDRTVVGIPGPRRISKQIKITLSKIYRIGKDRTANIESVIAFLQSIFQNVDEPTRVEILGYLNRDDFFDLPQISDEQFNDYLDSSLSKSVSILPDSEFKEKILQNFDRIFLK